MLLNVDTSGNVEFVQSWTDLVRGTDYTYTLESLTPRLLSGVRCPWASTFPTRRPLHRRFTLTQVRGEPFGINVRERLIARRQPSIDAYGPRPVIYPSDLISNLEEIRDHLEWARQFARRHRRQGPKGPERGSRGALPPSISLDPANAGVIGVDIGGNALAEITEPRLGLEAERPSGWTAAEYSVVADPYAFRVTLELSDARASMMWALGRMKFGFNTRVGF